MAGGAASFVTGLGFLTQVAFADPNSIATVDQTQMASVSSSNVLLSGGAPSFGGGGSFETLDCKYHATTCFGIVVLLDSLFTIHVHICLLSFFTQLRSGH